MEIAARVPAARLLAARPAFVPEAQVRARLRAPTTGPADDWTTAQVPVKGTVACFPCSMTMTLAGLGFINIPPGTVRTGEIQALAQAIYQYYSDKYANGRFGRGMPEIFPFPPDPSMADALATTIATTPIPAVRALASQMLDALRPMYLEHWPYAEGDDDTMKWLISVRGQETRAVGAERIAVDVENMRPWQWAWIVGGFVRDTYHGGDASRIAWYTTDAREHPEWCNLFAPDPKKVAHVLGSGWGSVTSIKHLTEGGEGGHLIALVGAVVDSSGNIVRLIFHDPYGDQSRNPTIPGYYHLNRPVYNDRSKFDRDPVSFAEIPNPGGDSWGRYAPYGPDINSFGGTMTGKFWGLYAPKEQMTPHLMVKRMLPSVSASSASSVSPGPTTAPSR
jgi:hypothetical protein